ncbi:hypothetical protein RhiJN_12885 [Ceratobasidium sp. AG-Ba]|nr:hypothetical protein RhiJN_12885 [Ceratobasidium sp. AG-Ba]
MGERLARGVVTVGSSYGSSGIVGVVEGGRSEGARDEASAPTSRNSWRMLSGRFVNRWHVLCSLALKQRRQTRDGVNSDSDCTLGERAVGVSSPGESTIGVRSLGVTAIGVRSLGDTTVGVRAGEEIVIRWRDWVRDDGVCIDGDTIDVSCSIEFMDGDGAKMAVVTEAG